MVEMSNLETEKNIADKELEKNNTNAEELCYDLANILFDKWINEKKNE